MLKLRNFGFVRYRQYRGKSTKSLGRRPTPYGVGRTTLAQVLNLNSRGRLTPHGYSLTTLSKSVPAKKRLIMARQSACPNRRHLKLKICIFGLTLNEMQSKGINSLKNDIIFSKKHFFKTNILRVRKDCF